MDDVEGVHVLSLSIDRDGREMQFHPSAVETDRGVVLVDAGLPGMRDALAAQLDAVGLSLSAVSTVLLTHRHADHVGGAAAVAAETGALIAAPVEETPAIDGTSPADPPPGFPAPDPIPVDLQVVGGVTFRTAAGPMRVVETPGHTSGHVSVYLPDAGPGAGVVLAADAMTAEDALAGPNPQFTADPATAADSVARLAELDYDRVVCYHGGPVDATPADVRAVHESLSV